MKGENQSGVSTISLGRLQYSRRGTTGPTERRRRRRIIRIRRRRRVLEKLTGLQLVKKFPAFYGTRRFITAFTSDRHVSLS
jgi:hypothetical protein